MKADYALQRVKGIKKSFDNAIKNKIEEYKDNRIIEFYDTVEVFEIFTSTEGMTGAKELGELETPPTLKLEDGYSITITEKRFGGSVLLPESTYRREVKDNTLKVDAYIKRQRNQLLKTNTHLFLTNAFLMLNESHDSGSDYLAPDGVEITGAHTWASGGTFDNSATEALDSDAVDTALEYAGAFTDPSGKEMPLDFDTIIVKKGSAAHRQAIRLFAKGIVPTKVADINIYEGEFTIIATPYITTANKLKWWMRSSRLDNSLAVGIGELPTMREPLRESNEAIRSNVTGFWKQGVINMPFDYYGSDGTT